MCHCEQSAVKCFDCNVIIVFSNCDLISGINYEKKNKNKIVAQQM